MKGLVHICCAPDSIYFLEKLKNDFKDYEWIGFFYDPNIHPKSEYELRLVETQRVCQKLGIPLIEGKYDDDTWLDTVKGLEHEPEKSKRCEVCFDIRLKESFDFAKSLNAKAITTTLLMSPKKSLNQINLVASNMAKEYGIEFINVDYRKNGGVQKMHELSKAFEIYFQDYCGCIHGLFNQKQEDIYIENQDALYEWAKMSPGSKNESVFIKRIKLLAESIGLKTKEIPFNFIGWDLLQGYLKVDGKIIPSYIKYYSKSTNGIAKAKIDYIEKDTIYLNKQNIKITFKDIFDMSADPTFIVNPSYKDKLLNASKIEAFIKSQISYKNSLILFVFKEVINFYDIKSFKTYKDYFEPNLIPPIEDITEDTYAIIGAYDFGGYDRLTEYIDGKVYNNSGSLCNRIL